MTKQDAIGASQTTKARPTMAVRASAKNGPGTKRKIYIGIMKLLMGISVAITCGLVWFLIGYVLYRGLPNISWKLVSTSPSYLDDNIGILPDILNTLYIVIATLVVVLPLGVGAAIYLTEYASNKRIVGMIEYAAETLSGIPSIIYGLVGMLFFCQFLKLQTSLLAGAMTLVIMNLPTIMRTTQESLKTVPQSYREGAFGLGAGKWRVIRTVVLPGCIDGVVTGCILSVGRIIGESAALLFTAGLAHAVNGIIDGLHSAGATLTVALYMYAKEQGEFGVAFAIAAILMILTVCINLAATFAGKYFQRRKSQ
jgi:phosphate transport system permease protein